MTDELQEQNPQTQPQDQASQPQAPQAPQAVSQPSLDVDLDDSSFKPIPAAAPPAPAAQHVHHAQPSLSQVELDDSSFHPLGQPAPDNQLTLEQYAKMSPAQQAAFDKRIRDQRFDNAKAAVSGLASGAWDLAKGLVDLPAKAIAYEAAGRPAKEVEQEIFARQEAHKQQAYQQIKQDLSAGHYYKAVSGMLDLFDPRYDDPNDPAAQFMKQQYDASMLAKQRMEEAAKQKDWAAVTQHAAGMLPVANNVDAAVEQYRKQPSHDNLKNLFASIVPAFVPMATRGLVDVLPKTGVEEGLTKVATAPEEISKTIGRNSHIYDPSVDRVVPTEEVEQGANTRQDVGRAVQSAGEFNKMMTGKELDAARNAARQVNIDGRPSNTFRTAIQKIGDEANKPTLKSIPSDAMKSVKELADELGSKDKFTHDEFENYAQQIGDRIDSLEAEGVEGNARRLLTDLKKNLIQEYSDQLSAADPAVAQNLTRVNNEYASIMKNIRDNAPNAFEGNPEEVVRRIVNGSARETEVNGVMDELERYDRREHPTATNTNTVWMRQAVLYNQLQKYAARLENGQIVRVNPDPFIKALDSNPAFRRIYGDDFESLRQSLVDEANRQARRESMINAATKAGKTAAYAGVGVGALAAGLAYMQYRTGIPVASKLWDLISHNVAKKTSSGSPHEWSTK